MGSNNFSIALKLFREDYVAKSIRIFGEVEQRLVFNIGDYQFIVVPTVADKTGETFNPEHCNMAAHSNNMVIMLACKWVVEENDHGEALLNLLKKIIPSYQLSSPNHGVLPLVDLNLPLGDLKTGRGMMKSLADQWSWRMSDLPQSPNAQQGGATDH